jgi:hypothetical protein
MAVTDRDRAVVSEVTRFGAMTREQLMRMNLFQSKTRANERLKRLVASGYLRARAQAMLVGGPRLVYLPGPSIERSPIVRRRLVEASDAFLSHQLGLVDIHLAFEMKCQLSRWLVDKDLGSLSIGIQPDAYVEYAFGGLTYAAFVEYDRGTETLGRFERKIRAYVDLATSGKFERTFARRFFRTIVITDSPGRLTSLSQTTSTITDRIFRFTTLAELVRDGPFVSIWRRPGGQLLESLTAK